MPEHGVDRDLVAVHDVEDAVRHARLLQQLGNVDRCRRILLGGLEDEGVPARERGRPHPHGHHGRKVERSDSGNDAERLPDRVDVDTRRRLLRELTLQQLGDSAAVLDHLEPARNLAECVGEHLAVLGREEPRDVLAMLVDEIADAEEDRRALRERDGPPCSERFPRGLNSAIDLFGRREVDHAGLPAERRVVHRPTPPRFALDAAAADPMADPLEFLLLLDGRCG